MLAQAGLFEIPDGTAMIAEGDAARLHRQVRLEEPELAPALSYHAGLATADYILAHRIPLPAQTLLRCLPAWAAARALSRAIALHAWTFAGSGSFRVVDPWHFEITDNPLIRGERSAVPLCHWHVGVFTRLYQVLVAPDCTCTETECAAKTGGRICRFEMARPEA